MTSVARIRDVERQRSARRGGGRDLAGRVGRGDGEGVGCGGVGLGYAAVRTRPAAAAAARPARVRCGVMMLLAGGGSGRRGGAREAPVERGVRDIGGDRSTRRRRRGGGADGPDGAAGAEDEDRADDADVEHPGDDLQPRHPRGEADRRLEDRGEGAPGGIAALTSNAQPNGSRRPDRDRTGRRGRWARTRRRARGERRPPAGRGCRRPARRRPRRSGRRRSTLKKRRRSRRSIPRASSQPQPAAVRMPSSAPASAAGASPNDCTIDHSSSVVSMPSRATETKPSTISPHTAPRASARSMPASSVRLRVRPAFCIQKIIQVTIATAMSESVPPMSSCASNVRLYAPKVSTAPMASASAIASPTPAQRRGSTSWRPRRVT